MATNCFATFTLLSWAFALAAVPDTIVRSFVGFARRIRLAEAGRGSACATVEGLLAGVKYILFVIKSSSSSSSSRRLKAE